MKPVATYRIQLRNGVDFAAVQRVLPRLADLGITHLYLSPIQTAVAGSTHGYDVADPCEIDPCLGGIEGLAALSDAARDKGLGLILDIVPNHTAFHLDNPWLRDVLRRGQDSPYAYHFDIDWELGRLVLPFLPDPFEVMAARGDVTVTEGPDPAMQVAGLSIPVNPDTRKGPVLSDADLLNLHDAQAWRLTHWMLERDGVTHRRFFNVTGLIGMRVEEAAVFDDMHRLPLDLIARGLIHGLRIDHIDGLADPAGYLARLRAAVGDTPVWLEKILTRDEALRPWPVQGTTGYEATRQITRLLTDAGGLARLDADWRAETAITDSFPQILAAAKHTVLRFELAAELLALIDLARPIRDADPALDAGDEALREAVVALMSAFPRYRSYLDDAPPDPQDLRLWQETGDAAAAPLRDPRVVHRLVQALTMAGTDAERRFRTRVQQTTGALVAKSHEDTALFRFSRYLALNEVGCDPDEPPLPPDAFATWATQRGKDWPHAMVLTSTHDTKRAEDARMRIAAISHLPDDWADLRAQADDILSGIAPNTRWYLLQSWLAITETGRPDIPDRLAAHMEKALREAKELTSPTHPDRAAEAPILAAARALAVAWQTPPAPARRLMARADDLSLAQLAVKLMLPGIPDIYQGAEHAVHHLTDPDNRLPVDFEALTRPPAYGLSGKKADLTRAMLSLRHRVDLCGRLEGHGTATRLTLRHMAADGTLTLTFTAGGKAEAGKGRAIWPPDTGTEAVALAWEPA